MFKTKTTIRKKVMDKIESHIKAAEDRYTEKRDALSDVHSDQIESMFDRHANEHDALLTDTVNELFKNLF